MKNLSHERQSSSQGPKRVTFQNIYHDTPHSNIYKGGEEEEEKKTINDNGYVILKAT